MQNEFISKQPQNLVFGYPLSLIEVEASYSTFIIT